MSATDLPTWKGFGVGWSSNLIVENITLDRIMILKTTDYWPIMAVYMMFLLHINEDFDDDLLQDAISMLVD